MLGADVLDVDPPELRRRGAARQRAAELAARPAGPHGASAELARRRVVRTADFVAMGWPVPADAAVHGPWLLAGGAGRRRSPHACPQVVARYRQLRPLEPGPPVEVLRRALDLPDAELRAGRRPAAARPAGRPGRRRGGRRSLRTVQAAVDAIRTRLAADPFAAPEAPELAAAGLGPRELAAAVRSGQLVRIAEGVYLAPGHRGGGAAAPGGARRSRSPLSQARQAWGTSRRVAVPLMEWLDARGVTVRGADNSRRLR